MKKVFLNVFKAQEQIATLESDNSNLLAKLKDLEDEKTELLSSLDKMVELINEGKEQIKQLQAQLAAADKSTDTKAASVVASLGVPTDTVTQSISTPETPTEILANFQSLKGVAQTEYYNKHKGTILQALGL